MAKMEVYRNFIEERSDTSVYFESILNTFIGLVQSPVNFAVFNQSGRCLFHFCTDKEHKLSFEELIIGKRWNNKNTFLLFPDILNYQYKISIILMHSKFAENNSKFTVINPSKSTGNIRNNYNYISLCAEKFFSDKWKEFDTYFSYKFHNALNNSLNKIAENHRWDGGSNGYPPNNEELFKTIHNTPHPNNDQESWHKVMSRIFQSAFESSDFGYESISSISHLKENNSNIVYLHEASQPTNMLVAYRCFTRKKDNYRHLNENGGYPYDTCFLVPDTGESRGSYSSFFYNLRKIGKNSFEQRNYTTFANIHAKHKKKNKHISIERFNLFKKIAKIIDDEFWNILDSKGGRDGIKEILSILSAPAGRHVRHLVDPVYYTGLIHINSLFDLWGFDRFNQSVFDEKKDYTTISDFNEKIKTDLLKPAILYYLLHGAASRDHPSSSTYHPENLSAFLIPVKMRGAVWAVTIHAFYASSEDSILSEEWNPEWMAKFLLCTVLQNKNQKIFDQILWNNFRNRLTELLIRNIGYSDIENFVTAIEKDVNDKIKGEKLLVPYALPEFTVSRGYDDSNSKYHVNVSNGNNEYINFSWKIKENNFFVARQPWDREGTRGFTDSVDLGVNKGLDMMFERAN